MTVLVIACPHALGLAIPLVIAISTAIAARDGILVKDRLALERMRTVDAVLFDKTGTLTTRRARRDRRRRRRCRRKTSCWRWPPRSRPTASTRWPGPSSRPPHERDAAVPTASGLPRRSPAAGSRRPSTASRSRSADRRCSANAASTTRPRSRRRSRHGGTRRGGTARRARRQVVGALALEDQIRPESRAGGRRAARAAACAS